MQKNHANDDVDNLIPNWRELLAEKVQKNIYLEQALKDRDQELFEVRQNLAKYDQDLFDVRQNLAKCDQDLFDVRQKLEIALIGDALKDGGKELESFMEASRGSKKQSEVFFWETKKILIDTQKLILACNENILAIKNNGELSIFIFLKKLKRKIRFLFSRKAQTINSEPALEVDRYPWLVLFDSNWYLRNNPDIAESGINPLLHYWQFGAKEGRNPNEYFDAQWYLEKNLDVRISSMDPLEHYWRFGGHEGRNPSPRFNTRAYCTSYPDVLGAGLNPLEHYLLFGKNEGRRVHGHNDATLNANQAFKESALEFLAPFNSFYKSLRADSVELEDVISSIKFEYPQSPLVSIIIPIYGKWEYTLQCLYALSLNMPTEFEVELIVVDDCSQDHSYSLLQKVEGIKLVKNNVNEGFIRSCNAGASIARGNYVCFLNNDTVIFPRWLEELVDTFANLPGTGLVGSQLIYPDGTLQEAGGIIWRDGSAWNYGNKQAPDMPVFNYAREVDYCSGASIIMPLFLFKELGGFDEHYLPLYCEDSDIALKVRQKGLRVIYQPLSKVIHFEGATSGNDLTVGPKKYQVANTEKLFERWKKSLEGYQENGQDIDGAKDRTARYRILVIDDQTPTPDKDAGSVTALNMMVLAREMGYQVTFMSDDNPTYIEKYTSTLQRLGIEVLYRPYVQTLEDHLKDYGKRYDLVLLFRAKVANTNINLIKTYCPQAKILYHTIDLHFLRLLRQSELENDPEIKNKSIAIKAIEYLAIQNSDISIVHSDEELNLLSPELPNSNIVLYPLVLNVPGTKVGFGERRDIVFVGGYNHPPNIDAVEYFVHEIMPLIRKRIRGVRFLVIGSNVPERIAKLASEDVVIVGFVENLREALEHVRVSVAPLRYGAGIKGKIGTAMSFGLPTVATPMAVEGMSLIDGVDLLVAQNPEDFATAIQKLYEDDSFWNSISENGVKKANHLWGPESSLKIFQNILTQLKLPFESPTRDIVLF